MNRAIFLDRDNTIIKNDGDLGDPGAVELIRGAAHAIGSLRHLGYRIVVVTNQGGVARGRYSEQDVDAVHQRIAELIHETAGGVIDRFYYCPFHPEGTVEEYAREHPWRKPQPGMLLQAAKDLDLDLSESWMIGDQERDIQAGLAANCQTILITKKGSIRTPAHYQTTTLAEAAAIIAQNRPRPIQNPRPIVVTTGTQPRSESIAAEPRAAVKAESELVAAKVSELDAPADESADRLEAGKKSARIRPTGKTRRSEKAREVEVEPVTKKSDDRPDSERSERRRADTASESTEKGRPARGNTASQTPNPDSTGTPTLSPESDTQPAGSLPPREAPIRTPSFRSAHRLRPSNATGSESSDGEKTRHLLTELLAEIRSWRQSTREFSAYQMLLSLTLMLVLITAVALPVYLEPMTALIWIGVLAVGQLMIIGLILLNQRR